MIEVRAQQLASMDGGIAAATALRVRLHLDRHHPALLRGLPAAALARRLEAVVAAGRGLGLRDLRAFCLLGALMLRFGPGVADHPELRRAVAAARSPDQGLLWLPATLEDGAWAGIACAAGRWDGAG